MQIASAVVSALILIIANSATAEAANQNADVVIEPGTHIPLTVINSVSSKHSVEGDRVYLRTAFPVVVGGTIAIPPGSYVMGTVTRLKRPGRVKGRGELFLRFDTLTLPNGVLRDFRGRLSSVDATANERVQGTEGVVKSDGNVGGDAKTIAEAAGTGAAVGVVAGSAAKAAGVGTVTGASAGAVVGILGVLLSRGPDAMLSQGSTIEMVLDRRVTFHPEELTFGDAPRP